ncbi:tRNA (adenosine(37)-N6)-dimethylallyltransferase MiaA [Ferruginibacter yonginensis]|uniref:tRNA dimethylallyltransferase n=1 Tax=Ferruginibacter yonginensis TaxID=1310416 RepID=A0ABV8QNM8_9BACT
MTPKTCIIILGPTASGKTALAIALAQHFKTSIISADSRQCFKELNIGVAKPSSAELQIVPHYFIDTHSINDAISAADFEKYALEKVATIFEKNDIVIMCGGTGLYIKAFCEGLDDIKPIDSAIRERWNKAYEQNGLAWLQHQIQEIDPLFYEKGEIHNPHRILRALEVKEGTGISILLQQKKQPKQRPFNILKFGMELPRAVLYQQINDRVVGMRKAGLTNEVQQLLPYKSLNALQTVGYRELFNFFEGQINEDKAYELIQQNTRHYAKRQLTWFKKDASVHWVNPTDAFINIITLLPKI